LIEERLRPHDLLARLGGDEFGILFRDCPALEAEQRAKEISAAIHGLRFHWSGRTLSNRVSVGLAPFDSATPAVDAILSAADAACFMAKEKGGGALHVFQPGDREIAQRYGQMQWISRIQRALDENRLCLYQQIIRPLRDVAAQPPLSELLVRLIDERGRVVYPGVFIPAAERYGLAPTIDRWVLSTALRKLRQQRSSGGQSMPRFAINVSGQSLGADGFLDFVVDQFNETGIAAERVLFEITETSAIANLQTAMRFISVLKEKGCRFVLDDFGQGLSSFGYLKNLPLDYLKIDGEFVRAMVNDPIQAALVASIHEIGKVMGLRTVAESVEDEPTLEALRKIGVDYGQGYHLHRPSPLVSGP
jgi:EAL domain-containing protein (putative c-di-GMP-specific phosphodiesterase class I)